MRMDILLIAAVAALASALTLYSGFGLGTVLLPTFALFMPAPLAVAATGVVHLLNNLFKGTLLKKRADWATVLKFGLPAVPAAVAGAWLLTLLGDTSQLFSWECLGRSFGPTGAGLTIGSLLGTKFSMRFIAYSNFMSFLAYTSFMRKIVYCKFMRFLT